LFSLEGHGSFARSLAFTPDGTRLASGAEDKTVKVWNVSTGQEVLRLKGYPAGVFSVTFSSDGTRLASACLDGTVKIWDARPLTPELFIEREALGLLEHLFAKPLCKADVIDYLRSAPTISRPTRDKALALIDGYREETKPEAYQQAAWAIIRQPYLNEFQYGFALRQAETVCRLAPQQHEYRTTLGVAQYRARKFAEAAATLKQGDLLNQGVPAELAFFALAQYRLDKKQDAQAVLARLRECMKNPKWSKDATAKAFLREAESVIKGEASISG
jgi:WD domain, G-beta repeat